MKAIEPMRSMSSLAISWIKPDISDEQWEFAHHPAKQEFFLRYGITWERLLQSSESGDFEPYSRGSHILGIPVALSYASYEDYVRYLSRAKRGYRRNYTQMEDDLQRSGSLALPSPIILQAGREALLFSGYRRLCLAWNYGMVPYVWLVKLPDA
jgi:hypothetical protein